MVIKDLLSRDAVFELRETDKGRVLIELARRAAALLDVDPETVAKALVKRENLGSTGLGDGMSLEAVVARAIRFVRLALIHAPGLGQGHGPMGHDLGLTPFAEWEG